MRAIRRLAEVQQHQLGPRLWIAGVRIHEWHAGVVLLLAAGVTVDMGLPLLPTLIAALAGAWLLIKDWNDLFPSRRDTAAWRVAVHRRPRSLRRERRADWLPSAAGLAVGAVAVMNIASALTANAHGRLHALAGAGLPEAIPRAAHAFALPVGAALLVTAFALARRRQRAWLIAVGALAAAGAINLLKGLDLTEAIACWGVMGLLIGGRDAFFVGPQGGPAAALRNAALVAASSLGVALSAIMAAAHWARPATTFNRALDEIVSRATLSPGPLHYHGPFGWVPFGIDAILAFALLGIAYVVFRPLAHPRAFPGAAVRRVAAAIVRAHGTDTLSPFKLRADQHYVFSDDRRAFAAYRIEGGRLVMSGDPVGPEDAIPSLLGKVFEAADVRGLKVVAVGASEGFAALARDGGLRSFYIGDEAIVDASSFSLEGRRIRKVRQAVTRIEREGYTIQVSEAGDLTAAALSELEDHAVAWLGGEEERGFSMATDGLRGEHLADSVLVVARDPDGAARGLLQFLPCHGRPAASLGVMRRDPATPNGLTEFMVVRALEALRDRGLTEVSLNFAPFARIIHSPGAAYERLLGRVALAADRWFQIERLYRFNSKFQPRWEPRYMLYDGLLGLPRAGLSVLWAEGHLPKPTLRIARARRQPARFAASTASGRAASA
jgi:lysyl-tRNA synthetase class 2